MVIPLTDRKNWWYNGKGLIYKIWATSNIGQNGHFLKKGNQKFHHPWVVSQVLRNGMLNGGVNSTVWGQVIGVQMQMQSVFFGIQLRVLVLRHTDN